PPRAGGSHRWRARRSAVPAGLRIPPGTRPGRRPPDDRTRSSGRGTPCGPEDARIAPMSSDLPAPPVGPAHPGSRSPAATRPDDAFARSLRGFGPIGILAILVILLVGSDLVLPVGGLLALAWAYRSRTPVRELGFVRPGNWLLTLAGGVALGVALKLLLKAIVLPLLGADPVNHAFHFLVGNRAA